MGDAPAGTGWTRDDAAGGTAPWRGAWRHGPYRAAAVVVLVTAVMAGLFALSYLDALGRPTARALPVGVVGSAERSVDVRHYVRGLDAATSHGLVVTRFASLAAAHRAVDRQELYAVVSASGSDAAHLELSSASGASVARVLQQASSTAQRTSGARLVVSDLHPLPSNDPSGLSAFYVTIAASIVGQVGTLQLRANAKPLVLREWLVATGALVVVSSLLIDLLTTTLLGLALPFAETWWALALQMGTVAAFASTMTVLVGRWALLPTWTLFILLGNTSSGGAVAPGLLPEPFSSLNRWLPSGATVSALRAAAYFPGSERWQPRLVLLGWAVACVAAMLVTCRLRRTSPGTPPS